MGKHRAYCVPLSKGTLLVPGNFDFSFTDKNRIRFSSYIHVSNQRSKKKWHGRRKFSPGLPIGSRESGVVVVVAACVFGELEVNIFWGRFHFKTQKVQDVFRDKRVQPFCPGNSALQRKKG